MLCGNTNFHFSNKNPLYVYCKLFGGYFENFYVSKKCTKTAGVCFWKSEVCSVTKCIRLRKNSLQVFENVFGLQVYSKIQKKSEFWCVRNLSINLRWACLMNHSVCSTRQKIQKCTCIVFIVMYIVYLPQRVQFHNERFCAAGVQLKKRLVMLNNCRKRLLWCHYNNIAVYYINCIYSSDCATVVY